jgi:hypothetical protein
MYMTAAKSKTATASNSVADYGMHELEFEPRNLREKWLLRIVYWGTILFGCFHVVGIRQGEIRRLTPQ